VLTEARNLEFPAIDFRLRHSLYAPTALTRL
jgi:hypothetical protein